MIRHRCLGAPALLAILISSISYASGPFAESRPLGTLMTGVHSSVTLNGASAISGTTVFRGDVLQTGSGTTAVVKLRSGSSLAMTENSEVALDLADASAGSIKMNLRRGAINLRNPNQLAEWVTVPGASVLVQSEQGFPAICRIAMVGQSSAIINDRGHVEIRGSGAPLILPIGQHATLEAGRPQGGATQEAGKVSAQIPKGHVVERNGQPASIQLNLNEKVYDNDLVKTESLGRVRILLTDNSLLNVGARSQMRITRHDPQSQQTEILLTAGKLRSQVQKLTHANGTFEVTTQTAVIGVAGTHFVVAADAKKTRVWCIEGLVKVRSLNAAIVGLILLHAGEYTVVPLGMAPAAATTVSPGEMQSQINVTNAEIAIPPVGLAASIANMGVVGAGAGAAAAGGVAISRSNRASTSLDQAGTTLNGATTTLNNANTNSTNALNNANNANAGATAATANLNSVLQELISPTYPCGCH